MSQLKVVARQLPVPVRRFGRSVVRRASGPVRAVRRVRNRQVANAQFFARFDEAATAFPLLGSLAPEERRSWDQFARRIQQARGDRARLQAIRWGAAPWTALQPRLGESCLAAAQEAVRHGDVARAEFLARSLRIANKRNKRVRVLSAEIFAARREWKTAQDFYAQSLGAPQNRARARAQQWGDRERSRQSVASFLREMPEPGTDGGRALMARARAAVVAGRVSGEEIDQIVSALVSEQISVGPAGELRPLYDHAGVVRRTRAVRLAPTDVARSVRTMNVTGFRSFVRGKRVALIANSPSLLGSGLGEVIDGYDVVMRFNSFALHPEDTGSKTDVHVSFHKYDFNMELPVPVRIVISARRELWEESLRLRLVPGAQEWLGDESLRWPAPSLGLIGEDEPFRLPTAGFNFMRLLMHLDVCRAIDLVGFDFYDSGKLRVDAALAIPHSPAHNSAAERAWVMQHATSVTPTIISMR